LAECAAKIMIDDDSLSEALTDLNSHIKTSSLNATGSMAEIVGQLLFLLAHDNAAMSARRGSFSKAVTVEQLLSALVGRNQYLNTTRKHISEEMSQGLVCFTHFVKKLDEFTHEDVIPDFLARAAAVQLSDRTKNIDLAIAVVLKKDEPDGEIGYIVVQIKNKAEPVKLREVAKSTLPQSSFFTQFQNTNNQNEFLGIVLSLGESENFQHNLPNVELIEFRLRSQNSEDTTPKTHHNFILHGISMKTYPFLKNKVQGALKQLLDCDRSNLDSMITIYGKNMLEKVAVGCASYQKLNIRNTI
jgi:hypothetical protein